MSYLTKLLNSKKTSQSRPLLASRQVRNSAGGHGFEVDVWNRLDRFLILGTEGGSYYADEHELTLQNAIVVEQAIAADGVRVVNRIIDVSQQGRAPKNDPALLALAFAAKRGDNNTRAAAFAALPRVARTGTHLFHFAEYVKALGGWGRGTMRAFAQWYTDMEPARLALQAVKYQSRDGWSHRDVLRKVHPRAKTEQQEAIFHWMTKGWDGVGCEPHPDRVLATIWAFERAKRLANKADVPVLCDLIATYNLPQECVPSEMKRYPAVWEALLPNMGLTALLRNLARMTALGLLNEFSAAQATVAQRLTDRQALRSARVHPLSLLVAHNTYAKGHGEKGNLKWVPQPPIVDALDRAFYMSFETVTPTNTRTLLALDVSGSMASSTIAGMGGITPRVASAAMALLTASVEPKHAFVAFTNGPHKSAYSASHGVGAGIAPLQISTRWRLDQVVKELSGLPFGGTDCALPMMWAAANKISVDVFCIYTDSETWAGDTHPVQALRAYRQKMGLAAKLIVVGMVANGFSIADPKDGGMLDVVGFDTATPSIISDFSRH